MTIKFLADESCDFSIVRFLRAANYDVQAIMEIASGESDANIIQMAVTTGRVLITEDRDFGDLVYAHQKEHGGVILIRYPSTARKGMVDSVYALIREKGEVLSGCFVVVSPMKIRIRKRI